MVKPYDRAINHEAFQLLKFFLSGYKYNKARVISKELRFYETTTDDYHFITRFSVKYFCYDDKQSRQDCDQRTQFFCCVLKAKFSYTFIENCH